MSKSDRRRSAGPSRRPRSESPPAAPGQGLLPGLIRLGLGALVVAPLMVATEGAVLGDTLWIVQLWLGLGVLWAWNALRDGDGVVRWGWIDAAVAVLVAGHVASALSVFAWGGQKRAAVNMLWEWVALGVAFFLLRQLVRTQADGRRLVLVVLAGVVALSGLGVWQHYVAYPQTAAEYQAVRSELDRLETAPPQSPHEVRERDRRIGELRHELSSRGVPLEGPGRLMFEDRLQSSSEPFGMFSLANTFAGLLAAWLVVAVAMLCRMRRAGWTAIAPLALATGLIAYCLLLTQCRTAWVGTLAGLTVWGAAWLRRRSGRVGQAFQPDTVDPDVRPPRSQTFESESPNSEVLQPHGQAGKPDLRRLGPTVTLAAVLLVLLAWAGLSRGFDRDVIAGAPRSLKFRFEYWAGCLELVRERPVFGTGPGNFRQHYLKHKLPESSEEIAEPHNFVFDAWTSGGLAGLLGLLATIGLGGAAFWRRTGREFAPEGPDAASTTSVFRDPLVAGGGFAFVPVFAAGWLLGDGHDLRLGGLLAGWLAAVAVLGGAVARGPVPRAALGAACVALMVHLLGAGGIEMPAIVLMLVLLLVVGTLPEKADAAPTNESPDERRQVGRGGVLGVAAVLLVLFAACLMTATVPVLNRTALVRMGDAALAHEGSPLQAARLYAQAAVADPLSPEPSERLADLAFRRSLGGPGVADDEFRRGEAFLEIAIGLDPYNANGRRALGRWRMARFARTRDPADARSAAEAFAAAIDRYPHNAHLLAESAEALFEAGDRDAAARQASRALELDRINRRAGHRDKYLPEPTLEALRRIAGPAEADSELIGTDGRLE